MKTKQEEKILKTLIPPKEFKGIKAYEYNIEHCPYYDGYKPTNLSHEVCKFCGGISYYH